MAAVFFSEIGAFLGYHCRPCRPKNQHHHPDAHGATNPNNPSPKTDRKPFGETPSGGLFFQVERQKGVADFLQRRRTRRWNRCRGAGRCRIGGRRSPAFRWKDLHHAPALRAFENLPERLRAQYGDPRLTGSTVGREQCLSHVPIPKGDSPIFADYADWRRPSVDGARVPGKVGTVSRFSFSGLEKNPKKTPPSSQGSGRGLI